MLSITSSTIWNRTIRFIYTLLFPEYCLGCGAEGVWLCQQCLDAMSLNTYPLCPVCSKKTHEGIVCRQCRKTHKLKLRRFFAPLPYRHPLVENLIKNAKYEPYFAKELLGPGVQILLNFLVFNQFKKLIDDPKNKQKILITAVPLFKPRLRYRNFNQSEVIGQALADFFALPFHGAILERLKNTKQQSQLSTPEERRTNVEKAFRCPNAKLIRDKIIILVDDVYTSGSTLNECARTLREDGAKEVWGITLAR